MNAITDTRHAAAARSIGAILIDSGRLTPKAVGRILDIHKEQGLRFGDAAIQPGLLTEEDIQRALSQQYSYTYLIQAAMVAKIYKQNLSRVYRNAEGDRIMLSVVYGSDQSDAMQVHKPEVCYLAQGFTLQEVSRSVLGIQNRQIPAVRLKTVLGRRVEPITYWTTVGDQIVAGGIHKKLLELGCGLNGKIPDGMLVRISSIDPDAPHAYAMHDRFAGEMYLAIPTEYRNRIFENP